MPTDVARRGHALARPDTHRTARHGGPDCRRRTERGPQARGPVVPGGRAPRRPARTVPGGAPRDDFLSPYLTSGTERANGRSTPPTPKRRSHAPTAPVRE